MWIDALIRTKPTSAAPRRFTAMDGKARTSVLACITKTVAAPSRIFQISGANDSCTIHIVPLRAMPDSRMPPHCVDCVEPSCAQGAGGPYETFAVHALGLVVAPDGSSSNVRMVLSST